MAFRFEENESVADGLRRVVRKELKKASERLTDDRSDEAIHATRKSVKKVRAVLQLVGDELRANGDAKDLRRANRLLSPLRDADAVIETARNLRARGPAFDTLDEHLTAEKTRLAADATRNRIRKTAARALTDVRRDARDWRWTRADFSVLLDAIKRSYKRARTAMDDARHAMEPESFHEWRKKVKTLWYALRLLEGRGLPLRRLVADLKRLETGLGDDHNLAVLDQQLGTGSASRHSARDRQHLRTLIERRQLTLRRQALTLGARVFADSPKEFAQRLRKMWARARADTKRAPQRQTAAA